MERVLIKFGHGLGDCIQLTVVLQHLKKYKPDWIVDVLSSYGKHSAFNYQCNRTLHESSAVNSKEYNQIFDLSWDEPYESFADHPGTKAERCLKDVFKIPIDKDLCSYKVIFNSSLNVVEEYLSSICKGKNKINGKWPVVAIHYQGNTAIGQKNIDHTTIHQLCESVIKKGFVPMILDWDNRSPLPDNVNIFCPNVYSFLWGGQGTGDAQILAALIDNCSLFIGIDSGPQKVAAITSTKSIAIWVGHHPVNYYGLNQNVFHLVPHHHKNMIRGDKDKGLTFFRREYKHKIYDNLSIDLINIVSNLLDDKDPNTALDAQYIINEFVKPYQKDLDLAEAKKISLINKQFTYERCGHDKRNIQFLANGKIGEGAAGMERTWDIIVKSGIPRLIVKADNEAITFDAEEDRNGQWHGRWFQYERMPIILSPKNYILPDKSKLSDFTIIIQGPLNKTSIDNIKNYINFGKVIVSCWVTDDLSLLSDIYDEIIIIKNIYPINIKNNNGNVAKQIVSTLSGLRLCNTEYAIKVRADEYFTDLSVLLQKITDNPNKIISTTSGFKDIPYHPCDHILAGKTELLRNGFEKALKITKDEEKYPLDLLVTPERIICLGILMAQNVKPDKSKWISHMKDYFDIVPMGVLGEIKWVCNARAINSTKDNYNTFEPILIHKTIMDMHELGSSDVNKRF